MRFATSHRTIRASTAIQRESHSLDSAEKGRIYNPCGSSVQSDRSTGSTVLLDRQMSYINDWVRFLTRSWLSSIIKLSVMLDNKEGGRNFLFAQCTEMLSFVRPYLLLLVEPCAKKNSIDNHCPLPLEGAQFLFTENRVNRPMADNSHFRVSYAAASLLN